MTKFYQPALKINGACSEFDWKKKNDSKKLFENWARLTIPLSLPLPVFFLVPFLSFLSKHNFMSTSSESQFWDTNGGGSKYALRNQNYFRCCRRQRKLCHTGILLALELHRLGVKSLICHIISRPPEQFSWSLRASASLSVKEEQHLRRTTSYGED